MVKSASIVAVQQVMKRMIFQAFPELCAATGSFPGVLQDVCSFPHLLPCLYLHNRHLLSGRQWVLLKHLFAAGCGFAVLPRTHPYMGHLDIHHNEIIASFRRILEKPHPFQSVFSLIYRDACVFQKFQNYLAINFYILA